MKYILLHEASIAYTIEYGSENSVIAAASSFDK
jgi:hypothetical protein